MLSNYRNSIPPTTTVENLNIKRDVARGKVFVDVAFWGGVIPGNEDELCAMVNEGVVGFKCFLCPSGVPEFPNVNATQVEIALQKLQNTDSVLAVGIQTKILKVSIINNSFFNKFCMNCSSTQKYAH